MEVKVGGAPPESVEWLKDGQPMKVGGRVRTEEGPNGVYRLIVDDAAPEDEGEITVIVKNGEGKVESSGDVRVEKEEPKKVRKRENEKKDK